MMKRGDFISILLTFFISFGLSELLPAQSTNDSDNQLNLQTRIAYQEKLERIYWQNRIWPKENSQPKPAFAESISSSAIRDKIENYLQKSTALRNIWNSTISSERVQLELNRISASTKNPQMLEQIFDALDHDPNVIAECLVRPILVNKTLRERYSYDKKFHGEVRATAEEDLARYKSIEELRTTNANYTEVELVLDDQIKQPSHESNQRIYVSKQEWEEVISGLRTSFSPIRKIPIGTLSKLQEDENSFYVTSVLEKNTNSINIAYVRWNKKPFDQWWKEVRNQFDPNIPDKFEYTLPSISGTNCSDDSWKPTIVSSPPSTRLDHSGVWTGTEMIIWGGWNGLNNLNTGGKYDPATDTWIPTSTVNAPTLSGHVRVWSGSELIVWNGQMQVGARYNPSTDSWQSISINNAPPVSTGVSAVWNGSEMMVWGWTGPINVGGKYNPNSNSWTSISNSGAPGARFYHSAVWTGTEMIIWGGYGCVDPPTCNSWDELNNGGRYQPGSDSWLPMSTSNAPIPRELHSTVWTGSMMIVWGGQTDPAGSFINSGGIYDPNLDQWTASTSLINAPLARADHTAIWTGTEMIIWGDYTFIPEERFSGGRYNPATDSWSATNQTDAPQIYNGHTAIWTGSEMIVWGGVVCTPPTCEALPSYNIGGRYNPQTDSWIPTSSSGTPSARSGHRAVWTGTEMIVWGEGILAGDYPDTGARYDPAIDSWQSTSIVDAPTARGSYTSIWSGLEMIVWGGAGSGSSPYLNTGGKYNPATDSWIATTTTNAPQARSDHTAVWTGTDMIIWGGSASSSYYSVGGRYNPSTDSWLPTGINNVPEVRGGHAAEWTGSEMIIWGGWSLPSGYLQTGGRYNPNTDSWTATTLNQAPEARTYHSSVWTGLEMIIWGGTNGPSTIVTGARYNPSNDTWTSTGTSQAPAARIGHTGVWANNRMIIWGGTNGNYLNTGALYNPVDDSWTPTSLVNAPDPRSGHSAVWTGSQMIVWGGTADFIGPTGGLYCHVSQAPPNAVDDQYVVLEDTLLDVQAPGVLANDSGNGGNLTAVLDVGPSHGILQLNSDGSFTYNPSSNFNGVDSFTYHAVEGGEASNIATVTITISAVNDPPDAIDDLVSTPSGVTGLFAVLTNDLDAEADVLTISAYTQGNNGSVTSDGTIITYTPNPGFAGTDTFTYTASDGNAGFDTATVTVDVISCLISDDFEDGTIDLSKWTILKNSWQEISGELVGTPVQRKAFIFASGFAGCDHCTIQTAVSTNGGSLARVWITGWYQDKKNKIEPCSKKIQTV